MSIYIDRHIGCGGVNEKKEGKGDRHYEPNERRERERFGIGFLLRVVCTSMYSIVQVQAQVSTCRLIYFTSRGENGLFLGLSILYIQYVLVRICLCLCLCLSKTKSIII